MDKRENIVLADVLQEKGYIRGPFGSALRRPDMKTSGIPVYEQQQAINNTRDFRFFIDENKFSEMKRFQVQTDDLLISCSGTVGKVTIIKEDDPKGIISQALLILRANTNKVLPEYLKYFFSSQKGYNSIVSRSSGSVQVNISRREVIEQIPLELPSLSDQRKIVGVLKSIDDKIENNNKINGNLLDQAKSIYKSWFIDFGQSDGEMPGDWHVGTVDEIIELHDSKRKPLSGNERDKLAKIYPYYGATSIMDYVDKYIFDGIYLLMGEDGSVIDEDGYPILQYVFGKFWPNNHAHVISSKNGFSVESLYLLFSMTNVNSIVTGAVQLKISQQNLKKVEVVIPSETAMNKFDAIIQPMFQKIRSLRLENENLIALRDSLLPRLMSGELDVSELEL